MMITTMTIILLLLLPIIIIMIIVIIIILRCTISTNYNLVTALRTVSNMYTQVAWAQSCANHVQHIGHLPNVTCTTLEFSDLAGGGAGGSKQKQMRFQLCQN